MSLNKCHCQFRRQTTQTKAVKHNISETDSKKQNAMEFCQYLNYLMQIYVNVVCINVVLDSIGLGCCA